METRNEMEIDILGLFLYLKTKIWIILGVTLAFAVGGYFCSRLLSTPVYTADSQLYVYQKSDDGLSTNSLSAAIMLRRDCAVIIKGESVTKPVIEKLGLKMSPKALGNAITVDAEENTRILALSFTSTNPEQAALVLNTVNEVAAEQIKEIMGVDVVKPVYEASVPRAVSNVNIKRNTVLSTLVGGVLIVSVLVVLFLLDDSIRNEDDVEMYLGLSTLAAIPLSNELYVARGSRLGSGKKKVFPKRNRG